MYEHLKVKLKELFNKIYKAGRNTQLISTQYKTTMIDVVYRT